MKIKMKSKIEKTLSSPFVNLTETSTGSALPLYTSSPPLLTTTIDSPPAYNNMSQINLHEIIRQQQEQLVAMQVQIQVLLAGGEGVGSTERGMIRFNLRPQMEVAKPAIFNGEAGMVGGFMIACRLYLKMKMKEVTVEEQVQWVLSYV